MRREGFVSCAGSYLITGIAFMLYALAGTDGRAFSEEVLTDADKTQKVLAMYENYKQSAFPNVEDITPEDALNLVQQEKIIFVDIRSREEQAISMLPGAVTEEAFLKDPQAYQDRVIIAYCTISYRSGLLVERYLKKSIRIVNLRGGLLGWLHAGGKVYDQNSETNRVHVYGKEWDLAPHTYVTTWFKTPFLKW